MQGNPLTRLHKQAIASNNKLLSWKNVLKVIVTWSLLSWLQVWSALSSTGIEEFLNVLLFSRPSLVHLHTDTSLSSHIWFDISAIFMDCAGKYGSESWSTYSGLVEIDYGQRQSVSCDPESLVRSPDSSSLSQKSFSDEVITTRFKLRN